MNLHHKVLSLAVASAFTFAGAASAQTVVKIGHVGPLTGGIAHLGKDNELGAKLAIEDLNAKGVKIGGQAVKFELLSEDDAADPKQGTAAATKLADAKVNGVIGHLNSPSRDSRAPSASSRTTASSAARWAGTRSRTSRPRASRSSTTAPPTARALPTNSRRRSRQRAARSWVASSPTTRRPTSTPS